MAAKGLSMGALLVMACGQPLRRLRITNGCRNEPVWIIRKARDAASSGLQILRIEPMEHHDFSTPSGPGAVLYWPRAGCDEQGRRCAIGTAADEACTDVNGTVDCAPAVDSKLEAIFGDASLPCDPASGRISGCDHVDMSLIGGFTLPFKFSRRGSCTERADEGIKSDMLDCSQLSLAQCPNAETAPGSPGWEADLQAVNRRTRQVSGCYAPCRKLLDERGNCTHAQESAYWGVVRQACRGHRRPSRSGSLPVTCHASAQYELTFLCPPPPARDVPPPTKAASAVAARRASSEDHRATTPADVPLVSDLDGAVQLATKEEACDAMCSFRGKSASCKFRVGWALQHRFQGDSRACPAALQMVQSQCDVCSGCSLSSLGCSAPGDTSGSEFDCMQELFNWQKAWTSAKKDWCCRHKERGCRAAAAPVEHGCDGAAEGWSSAHRTFCCRHSGAGCSPGTTERPPQLGGASLRATASAPQPSPRPAVAPPPSVPRTVVEALRRIIVGLFTGPVVALAASVVGSFLGLALCRECRELTSDRQQDSYPMIAGGNSQGGTPGSGSPMPGSPNGTPAFRANSALGTYGEMDMGAFASHVAAPPLNRAVSVPPAGRTTVPSISRAASGPPTSRAASAPGA
uniref:Uncharacterized protein n=1 Tax=Alexandrium monilatum TaxID=311494 RepID=A0A7S4SN67_9DINO